MSRPAIGKGANTTEGANQGPQQSDAGSPAIVNWSVSAQIAPRPSVRVSGRPGVRRDLQADELALPVPVEQQQDVALAGALLQCLAATEPDRKAIISSTYDAAEKLIRRLAWLRPAALATPLPATPRCAAAVCSASLLFCFLRPVALCALKAVICSECHAPFPAVSESRLCSAQVPAYATSHVLRGAAG